MIFRKFFSVSRNAPATQRNVISPSRQRQTMPVFFRTPDCGLSIRFVVARQRWRLGGTSARLIVKVSSNPSRKLAAAGPTDGPWAQRDTALERIHQVGRREWQKESGYRQQARVENSFFRYKSVLGGGLKARHGKAQRREVAIGCHILNRMAELGRPKSCAVVS